MGATPRHVKTTGKDEGQPPLNSMECGNFIRNTTIALGTLLVSSSLVMAAGMPGVVTGVDSKGMATVRTSDQKEHQVRVGEGLHLHDLRVECEMKNNAMACHPLQT